MQAKRGDDRIRDNYRHLAYNINDIACNNNSVFRDAGIWGYARYYCCMLSYM